MTRCTYLLPIRRAAFVREEAEQLGAYFAKLAAAGCEVIVADGSPPEVFAEHKHLWSAFCRHTEVDRRFGFLNDKVNGIHTGVELATNEKIILADDDVRYTPAEVERMILLLDEFEMVRPQNFLSPLPWWARMESARMLINRAVLKIGDYPGTCAFRRSTMLRIGHYDGDVLFDNEEIVRHFARAGAKIDYALDFFIQKRPPTLRKWKEQRPRQAYEDFGLRTKTAFFLTLPIILISSAVFGGVAGLVICIIIVAISSTALACAGGARGIASEYIPAWLCFYAPLWILERSFSTYWAVYWHLRYGGYPFGEKLLTKGIGRDWVAGGRIAAQAAAQQPNE